MADHIITDPITPTLAVDTAAAGGSPTERPPLNSSDKGDEQQHTVEPLHLDEANANMRTKLRIYATVAALYLVLFVAALDQTIIASDNHTPLHLRHALMLGYGLPERPSRQLPPLCTPPQDTHGSVAPTCWPTLQQGPFGPRVATSGGVSLLSWDQSLSLPSRASLPP
jgi:hypothetical protein